ncbi:2481_t:CDS:1, partial [Ambispora gerdemannii]
AEGSRTPDASSPRLGPGRSITHRQILAPRLLAQDWASWRPGDPGACVRTKFRTIRIDSTHEIFITNLIRSDL